MPRSSVSKDLGFTLAETLIVVAIGGILAAMAIPSMSAAINRAKLAQATEMVVASLQEAQREAIRRNRSCTVTLDKANRKVVGQQGCLLTGDRILPTEIELSYTGDGNIKYGIRGNTTNNESVVLKTVDSPNYRCLTISAPLGIIRLGSYDRKAEICDKLEI
jgi:prepilin-type N-terminal cleavage/methylation domain-containing protein